MPEALTHTVDAPSTREDPSSRAQALRWGDGERIAWEGAPTIHDRIRHVMATLPETVALVVDARDGRSEVTYAELEHRSLALACELSARGIGPGSVVGVHVERSAELLVSVLGVLRAGAAYVPLEVGYPEERLGYMLGDTRAGVVLVAGEGERPRWMPPAVELLDVGRVDAVAPPSGDLGPTARGDDLAYVLYTSGSTGRPKGVMVEHRSVVNRLCWMQAAYPIGPEDAVLQKTPVGFDVSVWELFWPLMHGTRLVLARPGGHRDPGYMASLVEQEAVTVMHFVPSMLQVFLEEPRLDTRCGTLRHVVCSGEALSYALARRFYERMPAVTLLHNLYGPTEAAVDVSHWTVPREPWLDDVVPIGRPVWNTGLYVLDAAGEPLGTGERGELHIGGIQVARGYWGRDELTRERFVDGVGVLAGRRLYRTGDAARWRPDGTLEYLGRLDRQVKIRGQRIEPAEVEATLERLDAVAQAAVELEDGAAAGPRLVAYLVPDGGRLPEPTELRRALARTLPDAWIPSEFRELARMPLTANGKLDRGALCRNDRQRDARSAPASRRQSRDPLERFLLDVWSEVLEVQVADTGCPFFELGGTSLAAARVINRVREALDEFVYVVTLFEAPTVASLAELLRREYPEAVSRRFGATGAARGAAPGKVAARVTDDDVARFETLVPRRVRVPPEPVDFPNAPAVFILAPPRSGTTLLRAMLAGHPRLFAAPELNLLGFDGMHERRVALTGRRRVWLEGLVRTVMEVRGVDAEEAWALIARDEEAGTSTRDFYGKLQGWIAPRTLVDKTPAYALSVDVLRKAEVAFRDPLYVHLTRHPYASVRSFEEQHLNQVLDIGEHDFDARRLGELVWLVSHRNVSGFLARVPRGRSARVRFEDLVTRPVHTLQALCEALGIEYVPEVADPYARLDGKMVDGIHPESTPMGDQKFAERSAIDTSVAARAEGARDDDFLGEATWRMAEALGYPRPAGPGVRPPKRRAAVREARLHARQGGRR